MKTKVFIPVAIAALFLSSCGTRAVVVEKTNETTTTTEYVAPQSADDRYFGIVLDNYPHIVNRNGRQWVIDFGNTVCEEIDNGLTLEQLLGMLSANTDGELVGFMVRYAILELCPRNQWFLDAAADA